MSTQVRCSVIDGVASDLATTLLGLVADWGISPSGSTIVTEDDGDVGAVLRAAGCPRGALVPLVEAGSDPFGVVLIALTHGTVAHADLCEIGATISGEALRATRDEQSQRRALYDAATGLPGPLLLDAVAEAAEPDQELALLLVSIDQLQSVSRSLGRATGNEMLRKVAARLLVAGGAGAWSAYRLPRGLGVLTVGPAGTADAAADTILQAMEAPWSLGRRSVRSTCRIGVAVRDDPTVGPDVLIERAEAALDAALARPRAGVVRFGPELTASAHEHLVLETLLQAALRSGELRVRYQPQVDVATRAVTGAEALVRWVRPSGVVTPDRFIPAAEATGVIVDIDRWVLHVACEQAQKWVAEGRRPLRMACNVSSLTLAAPGFAEHVMTELADSGLAPELLEIEVTESLSLFEGGDCVRELAALRDRGVHVAIDDFGTGYSNVGRLRELPVDRVKIDQSFVRDIADGDGAAMCSVIVGLAHTLDLDVIAEGVETDEQLGVLSDLGCAEFQGYLVSPPVEAADFELLLPA
jgi:EAL domain-containing protein (putative c-di-GMP-specific phosphodiesterase class I)/GGDEF domain-containing protein